MTDLFKDGFRRGLALWGDGLTAELISHRAGAKRAEGAEVFAQGMTAASEALMGWAGIAERSCRLAGLSREETELLREEARQAKP